MRTRRVRPAIQFCRDVVVVQPLSHKAVGQPADCSGLVVVFHTDQDMTTVALVGQRHHGSGDVLHELAVREALASLPFDSTRLVAGLDDRRQLLVAQHRNEGAYLR